MKKTSLALLTSLIAGGLLFLGSTNAMTYTVEGNTTKIAIPENRVGTTITRCDECEEETLTEFSGLLTKCEQKRDAGFDALVCLHNYQDSGPHNITYNGNGKYFENFSLNNSNVKSIDDFSTIGHATNIYIKNNSTLTSFNASVFSDLGAQNIHLENNQIAGFVGFIPYNVLQLYLNNNKLTTIPENVWSERDNYTIKLSETKKFPMNGYETNLIDLSDNLIKFIDITKIDGQDASYYSSENGYYQFENPTIYQFERFGYSHEMNPTTYDYQILHDGETVDDTSGTTDEMGITISTPLKPGNYKFQVCLHNDTEECDSINFFVKYDEEITFTYKNPQNQTPVGTLDGISFTWVRSGAYPESLISGYYYTLEKDGSEILSGSSSYNPTTLSLDPNLITSLTEDDPDGYNGDYTLTINLIDKEGKIIPIKNPAVAEFTILIDNAIYITSPTSTRHETQVDFKWQTSSSLFGYYDYYITDSSSCSESPSVKTGGISTTNPTTFNFSLENGNYLLCIDMYDSSNNKLNNITVSHSFSVVIPAVISITYPNQNSTISDQPIQFTRDSSLPTPYTFNNYTYTVKKGTDVVPNGSGTITSQYDRSFSLNNLEDGTYTVNVTMNHSGGSTGDTKIFTVNSSAGAYLNLTPFDGETITGNHVKQVPVAFSWGGGGSTLISKYSYRITNTSTSELIDSGTKNKNESLTLGTKELSSGNYRFEVTMLDGDSKPIINSGSDFTVVIPSELEILSPSTGLQTTKNITFSRSGFAEFTEHYSYQVKKTGNETPIKSGYDTNITSFSIPNMLNGEYTLTVSLLDSSNNPIKTRSRVFSIPDSQDLTLNISDGQNSVTTLRSKTGIFSRGGESENFDSYSYSVEGTTFKNKHYSYTGTSRSTAGNFTLNNLSTGRYRFTVTMLDSSKNPITGKYLDFNVVIPASLKITSHTDGAKITTSNTTFTWTGYSDTFTKYEYKLTGQPASSTTSSSFTTTLTNGNYTLTVKLYSGNTVVAQDSIDFNVNIPSTPTNPSTGGGGGGGGSSGKTHYNNNLKLSLGNDLPTTNERIDLIVKIDDKYTGKVTFPKLQYYSPDTEKWIDIPVTSKNYVSDYSDEAKLGYIKFTSSDDGRIDIPQFIKFSKNGYYRIYAEDKDGYDEYVEIYVSTKKTVTTNNNTNTIVTTNNPTTTNNNTNANSIIKEYLPEIFEAKDTQEEVYVARSCKRYTITYSDSLNVYTSPNLNISEYFVSKDYFKRYIDSKNKYQSGCPTNVGWISTNYSDKSNDNSRYTAPNGKVYFITGRDGNYYSNELNKELKTPTSFRTIQELKYYIRDRNPLISMAALGPAN